MNLPGLIDDIRDEINLNNGPITEFELQLFKSGYLDKHRIRYESHGYSDRNERIFLVKDGFPRIIEKDLKNGVGDVHYSINLSSCLPFEVNKAEFTQNLKSDTYD